MNMIQKQLHTVMWTRPFFFVGFAFFALLVYYSFSQSGLALILAAVLFLALVYISEVAFGFPVNMNLEWSNRDIPASVKQISALVRRAQKSIIIVSGSLSHSVYEHPSIQAAFLAKKKALQDGSLILRIYLTEDTADPQTKSFVKLLKELSTTVTILREGCINHFVAIDDRDIRLEEKHAIGASQRRAILRYSTPFLFHKVMYRLHRCEAEHLVGTVNLIPPEEI